MNHLKFGIASFLFVCLFVGAVISLALIPWAFIEHKMPMTAAIPTSFICTTVCLSSLSKVIDWMFSR